MFAAKHDFIMCEHPKKYSRVTKIPSHWAPTTRRNLNLSDDFHTEGKTMK